MTRTDAAFYYLQIGVGLSEKLWLYAQAEASELDVSSESFTETASVTSREDLGVALNYRFRYNLVLKAEYHEVAGEDFTFTPVFTPAGVLAQPLISPLTDGSYSIVSLSDGF